MMGDEVNMGFIPTDHVGYLERLKESGFEPRVIYDVGSCFLLWAKEAKRIWPNSTVYCFDASEPLPNLYERSGHPHHLGVLGKRDGDVVKFYQSKVHPSGNSYYREVGTSFFPKNDFVLKKTQTLDSVVRERGFPPPDFIKIDVQGSERDVLEGARDTLKTVKRLIVEMQGTQFNEGAPIVDATLPFIESLGFECTDRKFSDNNNVDADYGFVRKIPCSSSLEDLYQITRTNPIPATAWIRVRDHVPSLHIRTSPYVEGDRITLTMNLLSEMYSETNRDALPRDADLFLFSEDNPPETSFPIMAYSKKTSSNVIAIPGSTLMGNPTNDMSRLDTWSREWELNRDIHFVKRDDVLYWVGGSVQPYRESIVELCKHIPGTYVRIRIGEHDYEPLVQQGHHKYMMDMQGIGWSGRLMHLMWMGSVVFVLDRDLHEYWFRDNFVPWVHYIPVAHDGSDLEDALTRVKNMPDKGEHIAIACREKAREVLTEKHAKAHFATVLREYVRANGVIQHDHPSNVPDPKNPPTVFAVLYYVNNEPLGAKPPYDGFTIRSESGSSGTQSSAIVMIEQLKKEYPDSVCRYVDLNCSNYFSVVNGVEYRNDQEALKDVTVLITFPMIENLMLDSIGPSLKAVVIVVQIHDFFQRYDMQNNFYKLRDRGARLGTVFLCDWCEQHVRAHDVARIIEDFVDPNLIARIPNPIVSDCLPDLDDCLASERTDTFGFFACQERGGELAERVANVLGEKVRYASYANESSRSRSLGKIDLYKIMTRTKVFPYLLSLPNGSIHKDMHPCCVNEAIACGVHVVTYPQSAMTELFGDSCLWLDPPSQECTSKIRDVSYLPPTLELLTYDNVLNVSGKMTDLLSREEDRAHRRRNAERIRELYGSDRVGEMWVEYMERILGEKATKIAFWVSGDDGRKQPWNGYNIRWGGVGVSGSEQTAVAAAESLAREGHSVEIHSNNVLPSVVNGVTYRHSNRGETKGITHLVVYVQMGVQDFEKYRFPDLRCIVLHYQCTSYQKPHEMRQFIDAHPHATVKIVFPSAWTDAVTTGVPFVHQKPVWKAIIPNPIFSDVLPSVANLANEEERGLSFVWHAHWGRGGQIAMQTYGRFPSARIVMMDYTNAIELPPQGSYDPQLLTVLGSVDKSTVFEVLRKTSYFVYPLINPHPSLIVHKDTFGCVVAEAIAMGVIVITYPDAALPTLYPEGHGVVYLPRPTGTTFTEADKNDGDHRFDPSYLSIEAVDTIEKTIRSLEMDPGRKAEIRRKGIAYARERFSSDLVKWDFMLT